MSLLLNELGTATTTTGGSIPQRIRAALQDNVSRYEAYFTAAGGALNIRKCFYYLVNFQWTETTWRYQTNEEMGLPPITITPTTLDGTSESQPIAWLEANDAQRSLGSYIAPDGSSTAQLNILHGMLTLRPTST